MSFVFYYSLDCVSFQSILIKTNDLLLLFVALQKKASYNPGKNYNEFVDEMSFPFQSAKKWLQMRNNLCEYLFVL